MSYITEITDEYQHNSFIDNNPKCVMFFGSRMCGHCQHMKPLVNNLSKQYPNVKFAHVETTEVPTVHTDAVPVFVIYKYSRPVDKVLGADADKLTSSIQNNLAY